MAELAEAETENPHMHLCTFILYCIGSDTVTFWECPVEGGGGSVYSMRSDGRGRGESELSYPNLKSILNI